MHVSRDWRSACSLPPPPAFLQAVAEFNAGAYFQCHETLEALWLADVSPVRDFYKGIIQIAAGLYHRENGNARGCAKLLTRGTGYAERFAPHCQGVDVTGLVAMTRAVLEWCATAAPDASLPAHLVPRITLAAD